MICTNKQAQKVALVTGSARRIGAAIIKTLHGAGFRVLVHCYQAQNEAHRLAAELNTLRANSAYVICGDLTRPQTIAHIMAEIRHWAGRLDVLVNNASLFLKNDCQHAEPDTWQRLFALNVQAPFELSLAVQSLLALQSGIIINITDIHAEKPLKGYAIYCQSKAALLMQTKALARELAPRIRVNAIAPGAIAWPEHDNALDDATKQNIITKTPLACHGHPNYIATAVLMLVNNPFITGQVLNVDGGRSLM